MLVYLIRRLGQSLLVVAVMATLVFVAMFAVGDPVDILASPDADQFERDAIAKRLGLDRPLYEQFGALRLERAARRSRPLLRLQRAGRRGHPAAPAGDARARARRARSSRS